MSNTVKEVDESLELLKETKSNIRSAIEQKGVTVSDTDTFASYATKIGEISSGSGYGLKNLNPEQREQILCDGTYEGKLVEEGEIFTTYKGTFEKIHLLDHQVLDSNSIKEISLPTNPEYPMTGFTPLACVGDGKYVIAYFSESGLVSGVSTDLTTWEWHLNENITEGEYRGCIYAKGVFVAGDTYQTEKIIYSTDGLVWTVAENVKSSWLNETGVLFCHDKFYSVQTGGTSYYSEDGINWNTYTSTITGLNGGGIVYDGTNYICATASYVEYSSDGINWTASALPTSGYCSSIAANEKAVVIGDYNRHKIYYSTNHGVTWNTATLTNPPDYIGLYAAESNGVFLMGTGSYIEQSLLRSTDGVNWTNTDYLVPGDGLLGTTAGFIGNGFTSEDGLTIKRFDGRFDVSHATTFEDDKKVYSVAYGQMTTMNKNGAELLALSYSKNEILKNYVEKLDKNTEAVLLENGTFNNETVENGSAFVDSKNRNCLLLKYENSLLHNPLFEIDSKIAYGNGIFVTWPSSGSMSNIWHPAYSLDGITWYNCDITTNLARTVIFDGTQFVALAYDSESSSKTCTYSSIDGINWTKNALISSGTYQWWNSLAYKDGVYVCGNDSTGNSSVAYTSNLNSWNTVGIGTSSYCYAYANTNVFIVAIENSTSYKYSTNGSSWSSRTLPGTYGSMQTAGSYIYLKDKSGNNYYTSNGTSWNSFTPPANGKIVKSNNKYYCFSNYNTEIYESSDGLTNWTQIYSSTTSIYNSNICPVGNNKFFIGSAIIDLNKTNSYELYYTPASGLDKYVGYDTTKNQVLTNNKGNFEWGKAVQTIGTGSANGTISVDGTDVIVKGLGTAAYTASSAYATSTQGEKADTALQNTATQSTSLTINGTASTYRWSTNIGPSTTCSGQDSVAIGFSANAGQGGVSLGEMTQTGTNSIAVGIQARATGQNTIQIGWGTNSTNSTMNVGLSSDLNVQLLNESGTIPVARLGATSDDTTKFLRGDGTWQTFTGDYATTAYVDEQLGDIATLLDIINGEVI